MSIADLTGLSEGALLRMAEILLEAKLPHLKPHELIPHVTGIARSTVDQCKIGRGFIGGVGWVRIERVLDLKIYHQWLDFK